MFADEEEYFRRDRNGRGKEMAYVEHDVGY